jgi:branched-chain amino acid transport system substrate-binding protein
MLLAACGGSPTTAPAATTAPAVAATTAPAAVATTAPAVAATTAASGTVQTVAPVPNGDKTGVTDTEIRIGTFTPQTGGAAAYGLSARVIDAYFKKVNEEGGINGRKIKYIFEDDQYQAAKSLSAAKKLVEQDKIFAMIGNIGTANNLGVRDYLTENKVPNILFSTGSSALVTPPRKDWFGFLPTYPFEAQVLVEFASKDLKSKKVAIVYQNDGFGKDGQQAFAKAAPGKGLEIVAEVPYETGATDMSAQALKVQQSGADTVYIMAVPQPGSVLLKEFDKLGYKPKMLLSFVLNDTSFFAATGRASDGIYTTNFTPLPDGDDPKLAEFRDFMKKNFPNEQASNFALWGYNAVSIFVEGLRRAGKDLSRETMIAAMESFQNYNGTVIKDFTFGGPNNRAPIKTMYVMQWKDGKFAKVSDWITVTS